MNNTGNTKHNDNHVLKWLMLVLTCIFQLSPIGVKAQLVPRDIPTIEAYINDHKKQRSLLLARSTLEESNKLLHQASKVTHREYRDVNLELDKSGRRSQWVQDLIAHQNIPSLTRAVAVECMEQIRVYEDKTLEIEFAHAQDYAEMLAQVQESYSNVADSDKAVV